MKKGFLSEYFSEVAIKRLSTVESDIKKSNQHEINGVKDLIKIFGLAGSDKKKFDSNFLYLSDDEGVYESYRDTLTWYDSRYNHATRTEHRLYYPTNNITQRMKEGDILIIAKCPNSEILFLVVEGKSNIESQLLWLFDAGIISTTFSIKSIEYEDKKIDFATRFILEELGIQVKNIDESLLDTIISAFGDEFPTTREFSDFSRSTINIDTISNPDEAILAYMEREEMLFKTFEKYIIQKKMKSNKIIEGGDVESFIQFSLAIQNRRKSRAGLALENHLEAIFSSNKINYSRGKITENKSKPDFIFPNIETYHNIESSQNPLLTMLASKSTCKDRWRQVLAEAKKIDNKHLFTLEPSISQNQIEEMKINNLQLVLPKGLFVTYKTDQQNILMCLKDFLELVKNREIHIKLD